MQVNEETCISLSCSKIGLYTFTANNSANAPFLFCLDSLSKALTPCHGKVTGTTQNLVSAINHIC